MGLAILQPEFEQLFCDLNPNFIVIDMFHPWIVDVVAELGIPRIMFNGTSYLARSAAHSVEQCSPHLNVESDTDKFVLPGLPNTLEMTRLQLPDWLRSLN
ncbi:Soyasapogenol B glucuronide galactosyltransferase [Spatholobus suberectus]|nr:Soyasapogenol B glucuronide galactosyltransferase [Spatholobus suberectus]